MKIKLSDMISVAVFASLLFKTAFAIADLPKFCKVHHNSSGVLNCNLPVGEYIETENYDWGSAFIRGRNTYIGNKPAGAHSPDAILGYLDVEKSIKSLNDPEKIHVKCSGNSELSRLSHHRGKYNYDWISCSSSHPSCEKSQDYGGYNCQMGSMVHLVCASPGFHLTYAPYRGAHDMMVCQNDIGELSDIQGSYYSGSRTKTFTIDKGGVAKCITNGDLGYWQGDVGNPSGNFKCFIENPQAQYVGVYGQVVTLLK